MAEVNFDYVEQEALFSNDEGYFRIINLQEATKHLHDEYIIGEGGHYGRRSVNKNKPLQVSQSQD